MEASLAPVLPAWNPRGRILVKGGDQKGAGTKGGAGTGVGRETSRGSMWRRQEDEKGRSQKGQDLNYRGGAPGIKETGKGDEPGEGGRWDY